MRDTRWNRMRDTRWNRMCDTRWNRIYDPVVELVCPHICISIRGVSMKGDPQESVFVSCLYLAIEANRISGPFAVPT